LSEGMTGHSSLSEGMTGYSSFSEDWLGVVGCLRTDWL
jgi:hypothetical protein